MTDSVHSRWTRILDGVAFGARLPEFTWAATAWVLLAAFELFPALALWDVVSRQATRVSVQHVACSAGLGAWVGLAWIHAHQRMSRVPSVPPPWRRTVPALALPIVAFATLPHVLPLLAAWLEGHGHAHDAGVLEPPERYLSAAIVVWTTGAAALWARARPRRARWGGLALVALGWILSPHADANSIALAAGCAWIAAALWPARGAQE